MITCKVNEYIRPGGRKEQHEFQMDDKYQQAYTDMTEAGYTFSAEKLDVRNNVCISIENSKRDADMKLCNETMLILKFEEMLTDRKWEINHEDE